MRASRVKQPISTGKYRLNDASTVQKSSGVRNEESFSREISSRTKLDFNEQSELSSLIEGFKAPGNARRDKGEEISSSKG